MLGVVLIKCLFSEITRFLVYALDLNPCFSNHFSCLRSFPGQPEWVTLGSAVKKMHSPSQMFL